MDAVSQSVASSAIVLLPAAAGALIFAMPALRKRAAWMGALGSGAALVCVAGLAFQGAGGVHVAWSWAPALQVEIAWRIDAATLALAGLIALVGTLVIQFAGAYFGPSAKGSRAIATLCIFEASMLGLVLSDNLFGLFTFWELTGLCSFFLINTDADKREDTFASAQQALLVTVGGGLPMLLGFIVLAQHTGTASLTLLAQADISPQLQTWVLALVLPGVLAKSAQVPLHFWLPGAMAAPTPISAYLHSATMVKAGLILLLFLFPVCGESGLWTATLVPLGAVTCVWGSWRALGQDDIKLLMAWSTVSQLGLMAITLGLGTDLAVRAATLYLFAHALFKAGLFLSIGAIDHAAHTRMLPELGGLRRRTPTLFWVVALLCGSMAGLPPFAGFLSKELVLKKLLLADPWVHDVAVLGIVLGSIGTVAYTARFFLGTFAGEARSEGAAAAHSPGAAFIFGPGVLAALSLAGGLGAPYVDRWLLEPVSAALLGYPLDAPKLALWHGINVPLILSFVIISGGLLLHRVLEHRHLPSGPARWTGPRLFEGGLAGAQALGDRIARGLAGASPSVYIAFALFFGLAWALPLVGGLVQLGELRWQPAGVMALSLQMLALLGLVLLPGRISRILLLSAVGFTVAVFYRLLHAPDLALTQLLVEVLITVFFVLALRFVAARRPSVSGRSLPLRGLQIAFSLSMGLAAAGLVLALGSSPPDTRLHDYYAEAGPSIAQGLNLVNLILVDFRGVDTLIETFVVLAAVAGVAGWLLGNETYLLEGRGSEVRDTES
jgi:multicomponent Na+:H+ antiporter subunit A